MFMVASFPSPIRTGPGNGCSGPDYMYWSGNQSWSSAVVYVVHAYVKHQETKYWELPKLHSLPLKICPKFYFLKHILQGFLYSEGANWDLCLIHIYLMRSHKVCSIPYKEQNQ